MRKNGEKRESGDLEREMVHALWYNDGTYPTQNLLRNAPHTSNVACIKSYIPHNTWKFRYSYECPEQF